MFLHWRGPSKITTDTEYANAGRLQWVLPKVAKLLGSLYTSPRWLLQRWRWKLGLEVSIHVITSKFLEILGSTTYIEWSYKNIPLNLFHQICILLSYYTHKLQATYFVIHISINVCSVGYFSQATLPNVVGLCADRINSIIQPFQYKLAMANWGGQYLQRLCKSKPTIMQQICTWCMLIPNALDKYERQLFYSADKILLDSGETILIHQ